MCQCIYADTSGIAADIRIVLLAVLVAEYYIVAMIGMAVIIKSGRGSLTNDEYDNCAGTTSIAVDITSVFLVVSMLL